MLDRLVGLDHHPGAGIDAHHAPAESVLLRLEVGDAVGAHVFGDDQADACIRVVDGKVDHLILHLLVVGAVGARQPGREHGIELAARHALPHDPRRHRHQLHLVAELLADHLGGHMGGRHAVRPAVHVTDGDHRLVRRGRHPHSRRHCQARTPAQQSSHHSHQTYPLFYADGDAPRRSRHSAVPPSIIGAPGRRTALRTTPIAPDNDMPRTALRHAADVLRDSAIEALYALDWTGRFPLGRAPG